MAQSTGDYWVANYWPEGYWVEGYWPGGEPLVSIVDEGGAWADDRLLKMWGLEEEIPKVTEEIPFPVIGHAAGVVKLGIFAEAVVEHVEPLPIPEGDAAAELIIRFERTEGPDIARDGTVEGTLVPSLIGRSEASQGQVGDAFGTYHPDIQAVISVVHGVSLEAAIEVRQRIEAYAVGEYLEYTEEELLELAALVLSMQDDRPVEISDQEFEELMAIVMAAKDKGLI